MAAEVGIRRDAAPLREPAVPVRRRRGGRRAAARLRRQSRRRRAGRREATPAAPARGPGPTRRGGSGWRSEASVPRRAARRRAAPGRCRCARGRLCSRSLPHRCRWAARPAAPRTAPRGRRRSGGRATAGRGRDAAADGDGSGGRHGDEGTEAGLLAPGAVGDQHRPRARGEEDRRWRWGIAEPEHDPRCPVRRNGCQRGRRQRAGGGRHVDHDTARLAGGGDARAQVACIARAIGRRQHDDLHRLRRCQRQAVVGGHRVARG